MPLVAAWAFSAPEAAHTQRLWSVGELTHVPDGPAVVMEAFAVGPGLDGPGGVALPRVSAEVQVTYDYLRLGFGFLELPLPDGSVIEVENAVFKDRGGGNLMWTGEVPGAGYESVLFTVQDGHLVGWFGEPGEPKYVVHAGPDGRGSVAEEAGPAGDWCGVLHEPAGLPGSAGEAASAARGTLGAAGRLASAPHGVAVADPPRSVASEANGNSLDILVLYTTGTEHFWRVIGGPAVGIRQLGDYLNMVFRNGAIPATANLIGVRWDPEFSSPPNAQGGHFATPVWVGPGIPGGIPLWFREHLHSPRVVGMRRLQSPDLVSFIPSQGFGWRSGQAFGIRHHLQPRVYFSWSIPAPSTFAHEIGHNLGGEHEPVTFGNRFSGVQGFGGWPYRFGHTDMTSCAKRKGVGDTLYCPMTIMSYGRDASGDGDPKTVGSREPFYSSVRHRPNGWTIGVAGTSEVERVLRETVSVAARSGSITDTSVQTPQIGVRWLDRSTARVTWSGGSSSRQFYSVDVVSEEHSDRYWWNFNYSGDSSDNLALIRDLADTQTGVEVRGLRPGASYSVRVQDWSASRDPSDFARLERPRPTAGAPAAPSGLGAGVTGPDSLRLRWRDNSSNETGYEVWARKWSGEESEEVWRRYGGRLPAGARSADLRGLAADEEFCGRSGGNFWRSTGASWFNCELEKKGRYSFVVVADNDSGFSASAAFDFEFMPGPRAAPTPAGAVTNCAWRHAGLVLEGYEVVICVETPDGARRRAWDYGLEGDQSGLLYFFDRDNVEVLVKVLDGCAVNGHRWVFVAPVTDLSFQLGVGEIGPSIAGRRQLWRYDSQRRPQGELPGPWEETVGNPQGRTARTVSDTTAFPCTTAEVAAAKAKAADAGRVASGTAPGGRALPTSLSPGSATRLAAGATTDCEPSGAALTLRGGYSVSMCYETAQGATGDARDWGLDSSQSGLLYFFDRNNAEVLIKVLDGCGVNGHFWVFVAPVTDLAFNLEVSSPGGEAWTHRNRLGQTADAASDVSAFPCSA